MDREVNERLPCALLSTLPFNIVSHNRSSCHTMNPFPALVFIESTTQYNTIHIDKRHHDDPHFPLARP